MQKRTPILTAVVLVCALAGCSATERAASQAGAGVKNAVSPIVGAWKLRGDTPAPKANLPQFVRLDFKSSGKLDASYVAAGGALASVIDTPSKLKSENDTYVLHGKDGLSIVEGSRSLEYAWAVRDGKLFLTPSGSSSAMVYDSAS